MVNGVCVPEGSSMDIDVDRGSPADGLREDTALEGMVGVRGVGCWRMRRKPEIPSPWSCSVMIGDLLNSNKPDVSR